MNVELLEKTENSIVKVIQFKSFVEEIRILNANSNRRIGFNKSNKLYKLDPFLGSDDLLRVGADCGNPGSLIVELILWFFRNKAIYQKQ